MKRVVCFGEIMGRLNPEGYLKIGQANKFELSFAGAEANVAVSLANYGLDAVFVTKLPDNELGKAVIKTLRGYNVNVSEIVFGGERLGLYFVEKGASQRPSKVIYDRKYSSISTATKEEFDWDRIFDRADWFHFTGITPALSDDVAAVCNDACKVAKKKGIKVSCDLNYRQNLWLSEKAQKIMGEFMQYVDICIANEEDAEKVFGIKADSTDVTTGKLSHKGYISVAKQLVDRFGFKKVAITLRGSISASDNNWAGMLYANGANWFSKNYLIHIVDRVGGGDSFGGALIYALISEYEPQRAIEFAVAASCLKHTIEFDFNQVTVAEIEKLLSGDSSGRMQR
ncbi:MAG: sugar kinase [Candidatus Atribacteria bacterium]|nr:sugar kinase [Candidatus Atribacteria bacterium]